jgi:poly-gamma-glutamate synthesis protein (capsule biosynthesis protein)
MNRKANTLFLLSVCFVGAISGFLLYSSFSTTSNDRTLSIVFVGDIMIGRQVGRAMIHAEDPLLPFQHIYPEIRSADIAIGNLECVFVDTLITGTFFHEKILFPANRESIKGLKLAGFDYLSLANNHALDFGLKGLRSTIDVLQQNSITPAGFTASNPVHIETKGFAITMFCFWMNRERLWVVDPHEGYKELLPETLTNAIAQQKKTHDIVILFIHWGKEYTSYPTESQKRLAHLASRAGADLIVGHGPHQIQGMETYGNTLISYSLGNCIFDQKYEETKTGLVLRVYCDPEIGLVDTDVLPIRIQDYPYVPVYITGPEREQVKVHLSELSVNISR